VKPEATRLCWTRLPSYRRAAARDPSGPSACRLGGSRSLAAEDHHRHAQVSSGIGTGATGVSHSLPGPAVLLSARLPRFTSILKEAAGRLQAQTSKAGQLSPAAEWILDNYYIAVQAPAKCSKICPPHYERQLSRLQSGRRASTTFPQRLSNRRMPCSTWACPALCTGHIRKCSRSPWVSCGRFRPCCASVFWNAFWPAVARITELAGEAITEIAPVLKSPGQLDDQLIVENSIRSLRALAVYDWKRFFENLIWSMLPCVRTRPDCIPGWTLKRATVTGRLWKKLPIMGNVMNWQSPEVP